MKTKFIIFFGLFTILFITGCGKQTEEAKPQTEKKNKMSGVMVHNAWIRPAAQGANTALFGMIMNHTKDNDTLISASSDFADLTEVHETYKKDDDKMGMRHIDFIAVDSDDIFELKPRAHHIMLIKLMEDLKIGDTKEVTLTFKKAGEIKVTAEVKDMPGGEMDHSQH